MSSGRLFFVLALSFLSIFSSCHSGNPRDLIKHFREQTFLKPIQLADDGAIAESRRLVDSAYRTFPFVSLADEYRYNSFLYDIFRSFYSPIRNYDSALFYADKNLKLIEDNRMTGPMAREYAKVYSQKGSVYMEENGYDNAFYAYTRSRFIAETVHDSSMLAEYDYALGLVLYRQSRIPESISYYKKTVSEMWNTENNQNKYHQIQGSLNSIGFFYLQLGSLDSSWLYLKKAESYIETNKGIYSAGSKFPGIAAGVVYGNEAQVLQAQGKYSEAEAMYKKSIAINSQEGYDNNSALLVRLRLAASFITWNKPDSAIVYLNSVGKVIPSNYNDAKQLLWNNVRLTLKKIKADYYTKFGDKLQSSAALVDFLQYKDSIDRKSKKVQGINMNDAFDRLGKEYTVNLLQKENDLKRTYLVAIVIFSILLGVIGWMILRNLQRSKKMVATLKGLNEGIRDHGLELKRLLKELEGKNKQKDQILRIVVHDLRNPVSGIGTISNMLINRYPEDPSYQNLMKLIRTASSDSMELISEILNVTDVQQHTILEQRQVDPDTLVSESVELMRFNASEKQQSITVTPLGKAARIYVDPEKIRRVLNNLISNAIKFSAPGKTIGVAVTETPDSIRISVKDQGIGIPKKDQGKIFDMFTTTRRTGTGGEKSFGLGLSICLQIMEAHDGSIWLESEPGVGTTFYLGLKKDMEKL